MTKKLTEDTNKNKFLKIGKIAFGLFAVVLILEIWMTNRLSTYGSKIQEINDLKSQLTLENSLLENEIAQDSSLSVIEVKANSLGFESIKNIDYIKPEALAAVLY